MLLQHLRQYTGQSEEAPYHRTPNCTASVWLFQNFAHAHDLTFTAAERVLSSRPAVDLSTSGVSSPSAFSDDKCPSMVRNVLSQLGLQIPCPLVR